MKNNRRNFIRQLSGVAGAGILTTTPISAIAKIIKKDDTSQINDENNPFTISILQTTDVHCQLHPHDELFWENEKAVFRKTGGYAHLATYLKKERKKNPNTFLIDSGDMFQGSELSTKTTGKAILPILDALGYNLYLPGNWEVIYGKKVMQTLLGSLNAPKVCANMYHDLGNGNKGELIFPPYYIWHINGVKIGFLGYTDHLVPLRQSPNYSKGILYTKPEENLAHFVDVLRNQEKCTSVLIVAHLGLSQQIYLANLKECEGVDYILGGDTHERVRTPIQCQYAKVVEPGAFGSFVGKLNLTIQNGKVIKEDYCLDEIDTKQYQASKEIETIIKNNEEPFHEDIYKLAGYSTIPLYRYFVIENPIDTMVLDAMNWGLPQIDIVLSNGFRFCPPRTTPDHTGNIPITNGYIFDMLPVDSQIRTGTVTGKQIQVWLEKELNNVFAKNASERFGGWVIKFKGMRITFNAFGENGKRVQEIMINGFPIDATKNYTICACEREGDPADMVCRIKGASNVKTTENTLHSLLKSYLAVHSPVTPTPQMNAKVLDASQNLLTQISGVDYTFR
jgi:2',3'-cyclic-nucleotide 2'-phosphodiesterase (5'-nucleotidase family)